ncbi:hypothetical protein [Colwellia piezophila]|uniref:hypothetical protein n=1 Tax=Colwellia piezophila TaxID=211668 RepID=UPI0003617477|nr:hypothetical protein [Colwellia piezophila]
MDVTFFAAKNDCDFSSIEEVPESSILGGGNFTKEQIGDLLSCFKSASSALTDKLWLLPLNFSEELAIIDDEQLKNIAVHWSDEGSWGNININTMDLAGRLLEIKYNYLQHSDERIFVLFE